MALRDLPRKLTYDDYVRLPDDGQRHEILDGEHCVTPSPVPLHQRISIRLSTSLDLFVRKNGLGEVLTAPCDVVLSRHDVLEPDLLFISRQRAGIVTEKNVQGAPDLVVEILSDTTRRRDEGIKYDRYESFGVREYWLVDPSRQTLTVYRQGEQGFLQAAHLSAEAGDVLTTPLLPGLRIPLAEIFPK